MIRSLRIVDFRGFDEYSLSGLRKINLLVGKNNCGKTSILEAIHLLESKGNPSAIRSAMLRRGEFYREETEGPRSRISLDICHLFRRSNRSEKSLFRLESEEEKTSLNRSLSVRISEAHEYEKVESIPESLREQLDGNNALVFEGNPPPFTAALALTQRDGLSENQLDRPSRNQSDEGGPSGITVG